MTGTRPPRQPQVFSTDDPGLEMDPNEPERALKPSAAEVGGVNRPRLRLDDARRGFRWGALLLATLAALATLAIALSFTRFVSIAFERSDWVGWTAFTLLAVATLALVMILAREVIGFVRLRRLGHIRAEAERALAEGDIGLERRAAQRITLPLEGRAACAWPLARIREHSRDVHDPGDLLRIVDRYLLMSLDGEARRVVARAARRIGTVTAISPSALLTVVWVMIENLRLLRQVAAIYGGRPGYVATARLARMVLAHILATGGVAMTDDLVGQFLGQDLVRRLSRRLGESVFNAALTARIGAAAIEVIRPLPYLEAPPVRARDFITQIVRPGREFGPDASRPA